MSGEGIDIHALLTTLQSLDDGSPEREALIERLRREVETGAYQIDAAAIADKMIDEGLGK